MDVLNTLLNIDPNYIVIGMMAFFYSMEQLFAPRIKYQHRARHLFHNVLFQVAFVLCNLAWAVVTVFSIDWLNSRHIGLLFLFEMPFWVKLILGVAIVDFVTYWFHRGAHRNSLIWRFHRVHHSDMTMDASTTFRSHPLELIFWFGLSGIVSAAVFGIDPLSLGAYFLVSTPFFFLEHSNIRFPVWLDKTVGLIFTTPNLHRIHHEQDQEYTDSNYADIFIIWDRLFGTFKYKPVDQLNIGLKEFQAEEQQTFWYLMKSPFYSIKRTESSHEQVEDTKTRTIEIST